MSWAEKTIGDLVELQRGHDLPDSKRTSGNVPVVGSAGITGYHNLARAKAPGVTLGRSGASIGKVTFVSEDFWPHNACLYVKNFKGNDPRFVAYLLGTVPLAQLNSGAAQPSLNRNFVYGVKIKYPRLEEQKNIVNVLDKYDDLIENNKRRIELLEESARQLYKEWFVRFRFPGHEHVKIIDGVPEGWTKSSVGAIAFVFSGYAFKSKDWVEEGNPVIKIKNISSNNTVEINDCECVDDNVAEKAAKFKLAVGDMLIAMTGATVGKVGLMPSSERNFYLNQRVGKFVSKIERDVTPFLLPFFNSEIAQASIINLAGGAAQPNISAKQIESIEISLPPRQLIRIYFDELDHVFSLRANLVYQNLKLTQARDLLLPKLMSGEIKL
ncbi:restriction endonuclease subunit S [Methylicorpusculum sp.]|uniref:restriction endonuclease subunit S n=1 Tax=Methylicorpusculum sp. TaxID=2713644 RepID=UPI0027311467|nr:restriction endonuclease subunit S [Methylicorpusculum sp.]MDP2179227.1 restriction endonuclease subunit S [Methylicorpusculum sp.]MDP3528073.1 restriction endonuclease subunit S [Methylicorpusculum sp.]MDZ4153938.1 restriction endonuclease subunit S [Methylicorpusculum sp.]